MMCQFCCWGAPSVDDRDVDNTAGLLRVRVIRGVNLVVRDLGRRSSDPYVVLTLGSQIVRTKVVRQNCNPEWNEQLTLYPSKYVFAISLAVFDHDTFSADDKMGEAEIDLIPYMRCYNDLKKNTEKPEPQNGAIISKVLPTEKNCLAGESCIVWKDDRLVQEMRLRLKNVQCGEIDIEVALESVTR